MYAHASRAGLGDAYADLENDPTYTAGTDPYLNAIRAITVPMGLLQQQITNEVNDASNADASFDFTQLQSDIATMNTYAAALPAAIAAFKASPSYTADATTANELNNWLSFVVAWAGSTLQQVGALPTDVANYLAGQLQGIASAAGNAAAGAAWSFSKVLVPVAVVGLALLWYVKSAERTRTGRALAARV